MLGTVKFFNTGKGFGFIKPDEEGVGDVFVHYKAILSGGWKDLIGGDRVQFDVEPGKREGQLQAVNLRKVKGENDL